jgi:hypothetical protein
VFRHAFITNCLQVVWPSTAGALYFYVQSSASADFTSATTVNLTSPTPFSAVQYEYTFASPANSRQAQHALCMQSAYACMHGKPMTCPSPLPFCSNYYRVQALAHGAVLASSQGSQPQPTTIGTSLSVPGNTFVFPPPVGTTNNACSWATPCSTVGAALIHTTYDGATIWVGPGARLVLYSLEQDDAGQQLTPTTKSTGTYSGAGNANLTFAGRALHLASLAGAAVTIMDMQYAGRAFSFSTEQATSTITGLTMQHGLAAGGGAIYIGGATAEPYISYCTFISNIASAASEGGGAIGVYNNNATFTIVACTFINNTGPNGGGLLVDNTAVYDRNTNSVGGIMLGCYFWGNAANATGAGRGGGIFGARVILAACHLRRQAA